MTADQIIEGILGKEGGYVDHPSDKGGPTRWGITQTTARASAALLANLASLLLFVAVVASISPTLLRFALPALSDLMHNLPFVPDSFMISQEWKWVLIPLILILLMQFRPEGLLGNRELTQVFPRLKRLLTTARVE